MSEAADKWREKKRAYLTKYNADRGQPPPNDFEVEIYCMWKVGHGHPLKAEYCLNVFRMQWPKAVLQENLGISNRWLKRMVRALCMERFVSLLGTASSGKTFIAAAYVYTMWKCDPNNTSVYLSTTSQAAGEARTWGALKDLHKADLFKLGKRIEYRHMIVMENENEDKERDYRDSIAAVLIKAGNEGQNVVSTICGRKNINVLWCCDEFKFMDRGILEARLNLLSNPFCQFIGISNAPKEGDPAFEDATPVGMDFTDGWRTPGLIDRENWPTKMGVCEYFDGEKSPNLEVDPGQPVPFPRLCTRETIELIAKDAGGTDTPGYWTQIRGFPHSADVQDTVLTKTLLTTYKADQPALWRGERRRVLGGLDLGFREGGDPCVADFGELGMDASGLTVLMHERDAVIITTSSHSRDPFEIQIANGVIDQCQKRDCHDIELDVSGDGGIISQAIILRARERNYTLSVIPRSFSGKPDERQRFPVGGKSLPATEVFDRMVSQLWAGYRLLVIAGVIRGSNLFSKAVSQLCERKIRQDEKKKWSVEKKSEMKKRIKRSPDYGDSRVLLASLARRHGLGGDAAPTPAVRLPQDFGLAPTKPAYQHTTQPRAAYQNQR